MKKRLELLGRCAVSEPPTLGRYFFLHALLVATDELTCSSEESGMTSGFFSSPSPSSLWLPPPPLLLLDPGDPL